CSFCQTAYRRDARFCVHCGNALDLQFSRPPVPEKATAQASQDTASTPAASQQENVSKSQRGKVIPLPGLLEEAPTLLLSADDPLVKKFKSLANLQPSSSSTSERFSSSNTDFLALDDLLSEEELKIRDRVRDFCSREVLPVINEYWEKDQFPFELLPGLAALEIAGGTIHGYGCPAMSAVAAGLLTQELSRGDSGLCTFFGNHTFLAMRSIALFGSEEQKQHWLPAMARLEKIGGFALTEANVSSSEASALETRAHRVGNMYMLIGKKRWIINATYGDVFVVWAQDDNGKTGAFLVERNTPGFEAKIIPGKMAKRTLWCTDVTFNRVKIPLENRLSGVRSFQSAIRLLTGSRVIASWEATGLALAAYEVALDYASQRYQFGKPLTAFQLVQSRLATMLASVTSMQLMSLRLSQLQDAGKLTSARASLVKLSTARLAREVIADARDMLGANGLLFENRIARYHADVEAIVTYDGPDAIQALIVGQAITGQAAFEPPADKSRGKKQSGEALKKPS
ncbi:MAG TPA: acyl-CoA dehydrogenase family protein, partial [Ktedonobacteraceae bacterium]|nr:acyl-CoA dehydrogenase family protein [Ktedonobacteraceae bacterium]